MTIDEVIEYIRANSGPKEWQLVGDDIRSAAQVDGVTKQCPICWLGSRLGKNPSKERAVGFPEVGRALGLDYITVTHPIAAAADMCRVTDADEVDVRLRNRLLEACGLPTGNEKREERA